jgi:hypothetical protein
MMTGSVKDMRNSRGDGGSLFAGHRQTVEGVKMQMMSFAISPFQAAASQEKPFQILEISISYANLPTTFAGRGP